MIRLLAAASLGLVLTTSDPVIPPVRLDAVVTDTAGRPITDLRPRDFELRENGVVRQLAAVELRAPGRGSRAFAFLLDEYHVAPGAASERVRESLSRFLAENLRPGDVAAVIKPLDRVVSIPFTGDIAALSASIAAFDGRKGDYAARTAFEQEYIGRAPATVEAARRQIVSAALREIALRLGEISAERAVVVLVSDGFSRTPGPEQRQVRVPDLQALVRAASRFHVAVYGFSPGDLPPDGNSDAATLEWLANQTGGRASLDGSALDAALSRMAADLDTYYALTYQPSAADGRFHPLQVIAKRKNALVRTRPGYWSPLGSELRAALEPPSGPPIPKRGLKRSAAIDAWTGVSRGPDGRARLSVSWETRTAPTARVVMLNARSEAGAVLYEGELGPAGSAGAGVPTLATFEVPAGRIELDMTIVDVRGVVIDTDTRDIQVPDLAGRGKGPIMFTPQVIRARTAREFREVSAEAEAAPAASRAFTRGDRLLLRVPAYDPSGTAVTVTARITNAIGGEMRSLDRAQTAATADPTFDLPLAWLAPADYALVFSAKNENGEATQTVRFSVR